MGRIWVTGFVALSAAACAGPIAPLTSPLDGGRPWREVRSDHFTLYTDTSSDNARVLLHELEVGHFALQRGAFPYAAQLETRSRVVFFEDLPDLEELGHVEAVGVALRQSPYFDDEALILLADPQQKLDVALVLHELTHRFVHFYYPSAPTWLHEGLAEYYSTVRMEGGEAVFGDYLRDIIFIDRPDWGRARDGRLIVPIRSIPTIASLRAMDYDEFHSRSSSGIQDLRARKAHYAGAWALIHTVTSLPDGERRLFGYLDELYRGELSEQAAWQRTFGAFETSLELHFQSFLHARHFVRFYRKVGAPPELETTERAMTPSEVHTLWAVSRDDDSAAQRRRVRQDLDFAIAQDTKNSDAYLRRGLLNEEEGKLREAEQDFRRAVDATPHLARYTLGLARFRFQHAGELGSDVDSGELRQWVSRIAASPTSAAEFDFLGKWALFSKRPGSALRYAARGIRLDPSCFYCYSTMAAAYANLERWPDAVLAIRLAINLLPHGWRAPDYHARLGRYQAAALIKEANPQPP